MHRRLHAYTSENAALIAQHRQKREGEKREKRERRKRRERERESGKGKEWMSEGR